MLHGVLAQEGGPIDAVFGSFETNALWVILVISLVALVFAYYLVRGPGGAGGIAEDARDRHRDPGRCEGVPPPPVPHRGRVHGDHHGPAVLCAAGPRGRGHSEFALRFGRSLAFLLGAAFSAITGYVGMWLAVRANVRTANAAKESGLRKALRIAFRAGGVAGMFTVGLGLFGATVILLIYEQDDATAVLVGFGFGGRSSRCSCGSAGHLHQGRGRGGRPRRQGRGGDPRGRPAERGRDRRQRGRQRGRLCGDGGRPVRVVRGDPRRVVDPRAAAFAGTEVGAIAGVMFHCSFAPSG